MKSPQNPITRRTRLYGAERPIAKPAPTEVGDIFAGETLDQARARLLAALDSDAESVRLKHMTPGVGMAKVHEQKLAEANAVVAMGSAAGGGLDLGAIQAQFPMLSVSVGVEAPTLWAVAAIVLDRHARFIDLCRRVEEVRIAAKAAVRAATTVATARQVYASVAWPD